MKKDPHNTPRSLQNRAQLARVGVYDNAAGRGLLKKHFDNAVENDSNIIETFQNEWGSFQKRESLFVGPGGFLKFDSTWRVTGDGLSLSTVISRGGP